MFNYFNVSRDHFSQFRPSDPGRASQIWNFDVIFLQARCPSVMQRTTSAVPVRYVNNIALNQRARSHKKLTTLTHVVWPLDKLLVNYRMTYLVYLVYNFLVASFRPNLHFCVTYLPTTSCPFYYLRQPYRLLYFHL